MISIIIETYVIKCLHFAKLCIEGVRFQPKKAKVNNCKCQILITYLCHCFRYQLYTILLQFLSVLHYCSAVQCCRLASANFYDICRMDAEKWVDEPNFNWKQFKKNGMNYFSIWGVALEIQTKTSEYIIKEFPLWQSVFCCCPDWSC